MESSGRKRQKLMRRASGEFVCFVDDDDEVHDAYVEEILKASSGSPDVVTFDAVIDRRGHLTPISFVMEEDSPANAKYQANHLCAWRTDIARRVAWAPELGYGDDQVWYKPLHIGTPGLSAAHVPLLMYRYNQNPNTTRNQTAGQRRIARRYCGNSLGVFLEDGEILVQEGRHRAPSGPGLVVVRDRHNRVTVRQVSELLCAGRFQIK
jgi:hypothetical protein